MPIAGVDRPPEAVDDGEALAALARYEDFCDTREDALLDFTYNTARAYWGDLDDIFLWCEHRRFDIVELTAKQFGQYKALLRRRKYSEHTIRRRGVAFRHFQTAVARRTRNGPE